MQQVRHLPARRMQGDSVEISSMVANDDRDASFHRRFDGRDPDAISLRAVAGISGRPRVGRPADVDHDLGVGGEMPAFDDDRLEDLALPPE